MDMSRIRFLGNFQSVLLVQCMGIPMWSVWQIQQRQKNQKLIKLTNKRILLGEDLGVEWLVTVINISIFNTLQTI